MTAALKPRWLAEHAVISGERASDWHIRPTGLRETLCGWTQFGPSPRFGRTKLIGIEWDDEEAPAAADRCALCTNVLEQCKNTDGGTS